MKAQLFYKVVTDIDHFYAKKDYFHCEQKKVSRVMRELYARNTVKMWWFAKRTSLI